MVENLAAAGVDAVIAIGGDDTLGVANRLGALGVPVVGVPKTIDNDLSGTEVTFGFQTAVQTATEAIDRLATTAESHHRVMVCEVMGRHAGWIATAAGIAGGAAEILVPEVPFDLDAVCAKLSARHERGQFFSIVVVAEGALPADRRRGRVGPAAHVGGGRRRVRPRPPGRDRGLAGRASWSAGPVTSPASTTLGHIQRGGTPTAFDRVLATRFGVAAVEAVHDGDFGMHGRAAGGPDRPGAPGRGGRATQDPRPGPARRGGRRPSSVEAASGPWPGPIRRQGTATPSSVGRLLGATMLIATPVPSSKPARVVTLGHTCTCQW